ncbi:hypothetical protein ACFFS2_05945 [Streptomyces aurantiacus]|uniref:DUF2690 domain-containing protein n=1 Tax=Streptomyces aurantiacus TaxID=47760 RepID=A0A7G1P542_9ACTN|nr:hypothetical protein [Streptomyces aurantiacus]BCL28964.1 hypothetical protein GCM10017557_38230 [Streptomyces aurantiacus]
MTTQPSSSSRDAASSGDQTVPVGDREASDRAGETESGASGAESGSARRRRFDPTVVVAVITAAASVAVAAITVASQSDGSASGSGGDAKAVATARKDPVRPRSADPYAQGCGKDSKPVGGPAQIDGLGTARVYRSEMCATEWAALTAGKASVTFFLEKRGQSTAGQRVWGTVDGVRHTDPPNDPVPANAVDALHTPMVPATEDVMACVATKGYTPSSDGEKVCTGYQ